MIGSRGKMYSPSDYGEEQKLWPEESFKGHKDPERILPRHEKGRGEDDNQKREWVAAIRAGKPETALSNFAYAATLTEAMLLGNVAVRSGEAFHYDGNAGTITDSPKAARYLKPRFRRGWGI